MSGAWTIIFYRLIYESFVGTWVSVVIKQILIKTCSSCVTAADRPQTRSSVSAAAWPHARSIAATADLCYTCAAPIQVNVVRSITRTTNQRQRKRTAITGYTVNAENMTHVGRESYRAHAFWAIKRLVQKSTLAIVPLWFGGIETGLGGYSKKFHNSLTSCWSSRF